MKTKVAASNSAACSARLGPRSAERVWHIVALTVVAVLCLAAASCVGDRYVRDWTYNGVDFTDTLTLTESSFNLARVSVDGTEVFSGRFKSAEGLWRFEIEMWKTARGEEHHFDAPVVFVCRGRLFENGIALFSGRFVGKAPIVLFIRTPTDFDKQE